MAGLLRDRYFECAPNRTWDLVTGETVSPGGCHAVPRRTPAPGPLIELLDHGVEGVPRWIAGHGGSEPWREHAVMVAEEACHRGYVPIAVDIFLRMRPL